MTQRVRVPTCSTAAHKHSDNPRKEFCHRLQDFRENDNAIKHSNFSFLFSYRKAKHSLPMNLMVSQSGTDLRKLMYMKRVEFFWWFRKLKCGVCCTLEGRPSRCLNPPTFVKQLSLESKRRDPKLGYELQANIR